MAVIVSQSSYVNLNSQVFLSYFLSCPAEEKQWERGI